MELKYSVWRTQAHLGLLWCRVSHPVHDNLSCNVFQRCVRCLHGHGINFGCFVAIKGRLKIAAKAIETDQWACGSELPVNLGLVSVANDCYVRLHLSVTTEIFVTIWLAVVWCLY